MTTVLAICAFVFCVCFACGVYVGKLIIADELELENNEHFRLGSDDYFDRRNHHHRESDRDLFTVGKPNGPPIT